ncbi:hypothetical protein ACFE04_028012 [Oxalis oulophora]
MERKKQSGSSTLALIKKGPWTAEEDDILKKYVKRYGPRDWSSIRSMGLLPRTGKSCRLRWVNKLRPNLKSGCKFSEEEERIVIELQAKYGNKWAKISTCLHGRTDNDVKNFWSARRKRLAKNLPAVPLPSPKNDGKSRLHVPLSGSNPTKGESSSSIDVQLHNLSPFLGDFEMLPFTKPILENSFPIPDDASTRKISSCESSSSLCGFSNLFPPDIDLSFPEYQELMPEPIHSAFTDIFLGEEGFNLESVQDTLTGKLPSLGSEGNFQMGKNVKIDKPVNTNSYLDDFSTDIFDQLESLPSLSDWD